MAMMMSGDRVSGSPLSVAARPAVSEVGSGTVAVRPPWWCAHRSRSSALGVLTTAALVCLASAVAVVGFASTGSTIAALVALGVLAVGAANVVSGSFGAAWWARCARSEEVRPMNTTDGRRRVVDADEPGRAQPGDLPRRPVPVVPAAREPRTPVPGGRHAWAPVDEPTTRIPTPAAQGRPVPPFGPPQSVAPPRPPGPTDPTEALPAQDPSGRDPSDDDRPASTTGTVRAAAKRAAARSGPRVKRVAGRPSGDPR